MSDDKRQWMPHDGGPVPIPAGTKFDAKHRDGSITFGKEVLPFDRWYHMGTPCDIVGYRVRAAAKVGDGKDVTP